MIAITATARTWSVIATPITIGKTIVINMPMFTGTIKIAYDRLLTFGLPGS